MDQRDSQTDEEKSRSEETSGTRETSKQKFTDFIRWKVSLPVQVWVTKNIVEKVLEFFTGSPTRSKRGPFLTVVQSVRTWEKIRLPLLITVVVAMLIAVGAVTSSLLTSRKVEKTIIQAQDAEAKGRVQTLRIATALLSDLAAEHPDRCNVQSAWIWQALLHKELLGADGDEFLKGVEGAATRCDEGSSGVARAAGVAWLIEKGAEEKALRLCESQAKDDPDEPRLALVCAWAKKEAGRIDEALVDLQQARQKFPRYTPLWLMAGSIAYENDRWAQAIPLVQDLSKHSPRHLYGSLLTIALSLPGWGENPPSAKKIAAFARDLALLGAFVEKAPPKYRMLGLFLKGRIELLSGYPDRAMEILGEAAERSEKPEYMAWYALAARRAKGFEYALELLKEKDDLQGPLVWQLHADLLLELHRIEEAQPYLDKISKNNAMQDLLALDTWIGAIRSGDLKTAKNEMPAKIGEQQLFVALEFYEQLLERGDERGIRALTERMNSGLDECVEAIDSWHRGNARRALMKLGVYGKKDRGVCADALATMLLPGRVEPAWLKEVAERAVSASDGNLWIRIHAAHAIWRVDGLEAALGRLEEIRDLKPQGGPLRSVLARTYTLLGRPQSALEILGDTRSSQELAWAIDAAREADDDARVKALLTEAARRRQKGAKHPGLFCELLDRDYKSNQYKQVSESGKAYYKEGGRWAARIAEIAAWSYNHLGHRTEADQLLDIASRQLPKPSGLGISWDAATAAIRMNLRRGGKFISKARSKAAVLQRRGVRDPWISYAYGFANENVGQKETAAKYYSEALEIDPGFALAFKELDSMKSLTPEQKEKMARAQGSR